MSKRPKKVDLEGKGGLDQFFNTFSMFREPISLTYYIFLFLDFKGVAQCKGHRFESTQTRVLPGIRYDVQSFLTSLASWIRADQRFRNILEPVHTNILRQS